MIQTATDTAASVTTAPVTTRVRAHLAGTRRSTNERCSARDEGAPSGKGRSDATAPMKTTAPMAQAGGQPISPPATLVGKVSTGAQSAAAAAAAVTHTRS